MLAVLTEKVRESWREITDEQDTVRRLVLRTRLAVVCLVLLMLALWLLTKLDDDQRGLLWTLIGFLLYAVVAAYVCWLVASLVSRAQHRLASLGRPAGFLRAAVWSVVKGDASIKVACLLTVLLLVELKIGDRHFARNPLLIVWIICSLFTAGALPKDRYLAGKSRDASTAEKFVWVLVGSICGLSVASGLLGALICDCSFLSAAVLVTEPLFVSAALFGLCLMALNYSDPYARRRMNVAWGANSSRNGSAGEKAGSRPSPG